MMLHVCVCVCVGSQMSKDTVLKFLLPHFLPVFDGGPETVSSVFMIRSFSLYDPCFPLQVEQDVKKGWRNCSSRM